MGRRDLLVFQNGFCRGRCRTKRGRRSLSASGSKTTSRSRLRSRPWFRCGCRSRSDHGRSHGPHHDSGDEPRSGAQIKVKVHSGLKSARSGPTKNTPRHPNARRPRSRQDEHESVTINETQIPDAGILRSRQRIPFAFVGCRYRKSFAKPTRKI